MSAKLFLIPNILYEEAAADALPAENALKIATVRCFMVENEKSARRVLKKINPQFPIQECTLFELSEHTSTMQAKEFFETNCHQDIGIISEAGVPCVADPGAEVVRLAHEKNMEVVPLVGPSSIILALMASGLNGQNFAFHGYLSKEKNERVKKIKELEQLAQQNDQTQIFMETPYRNQNLFEELLGNLLGRTRLCIAADLTSPHQFVKTLTIQEWKKLNHKFEKHPALFLIGK